MSVLDETTRRALRACAQAALPKPGDGTWNVVIELLDELERTEGDLAVAVREATEARSKVQRVEAVLADQRAWCGYERLDVPSWRTTVDAALDLPAVQPEETQQ